MANIARPPKKVTVTFKGVDDGIPISPASPLLKYRMVGGPAAGTDLTLTEESEGVFTAEFPSVPGVHHLQAGSSSAGDLVEPIFLEHVIDPTGF